MLCRPMNVYPNNKTLDIRQNHYNGFHFTFYGSNLTAQSYSFYNARTKKLIVGSTAKYNGTTLPYKQNGDIVQSAFGNINGYLTNGNDYFYTIKLFHSEHDIPTVKGSFRSVSGTTIYVPYGTIGIEAPINYTYNNETTEIGCCYFEVLKSDGTAERKKITAISSTAETLNNESVVAVTIESAFSEATTYTRFTVYSNYLTSGEYYFQARKTPELTISKSFNYNKGILECSATYTQEQNTDIKYYQWTLKKATVGASSTTYTGTIPTLTEEQTSNMSTSYIYIGTDTTFIYNSSVSAVLEINDTSRNIVGFENGYLRLATDLNDIPQTGDTWTILYEYELETINQSPCIYSNQLDCVFEDAINVGKFSLNCVVVNQDNITSDKSITFTNNEISTDNVLTLNSINFDSEYSCMDLSFSITNISHSLNIYREEEGTGIYSIIHNGSYTLISGFNDQSETVTYNIKDYLIGSNRQYKYHIIPYISTGIKKPLTVSNYSDGSLITEDFDCWYLMGIKRRDDMCFSFNREIEDITVFNIEKNKDVWRLEANVECGDIVSNIGLSTYIGTASYPSASKNGNQYETISLSCDIGNLDCATNDFIDNFDKIKEWKKFITAFDYFILKSPKGDIWIVSFSDNPSRKYEQDSILSTSLNLSFTEVMKADKMAVTNGGGLLKENYEIL